MIVEWPDDAYAHLLLGTAYRQLGRWQEARVELERGAGSAPVWRQDAWDEEVILYKAGLDAELGRGSSTLRGRAAGFWHCHVGKAATTSPG